jgi:putative addiction module killer protein
MKEILIYDLENGKEPFSIWLKSIKDNLTRARIKSAVLKMANDNFADYKKLNNDISEIRLHFGSGYRIYFSELDNIIILLLCGGDKSTQTKDIEKAKVYLKDYKERKNDQKI